MKEILISIFFLCTVHQAYAQDDLIDRIASQAVEINSLKKELAAAITSNESYITQAQFSLKNMKDSVRLLKANLAELEKFKSGKEEFDSRLKAKTDSINLLKTQLSDERQNGRRTAKEERERGKNEALESIVRNYQSRQFDDLIKSSTRESVQRDLRLAGDNPDVNKTLSDLDKYFSAQELLTKRYDEYGISNAQTQLKAVNQHSELLNSLKDKVENYSIFSTGLKETMNKIAELDQNESVSGLGEEIEKQKFNKILKILTEISSYIFNYDFMLPDYPFLSDILLEIIKRKWPDADADISDLLQKL
jgi:hypothetical protein